MDHTHPSPYAFLRFALPPYSLLLAYVRNGRPLRSNKITDVFFAPSLNEGQLEVMQNPLNIIFYSNDPRSHERINVKRSIRMVTSDQTIMKALMRIILLMLIIITKGAVNKLLSLLRYWVLIQGHSKSLLMFY